MKAFARNEIDVWFHFAKPDAFGATLLVTTGTPEFVDRISRTRRKARPRAQREGAVRQSRTGLRRSGAPRKRRRSQTQAAPAARSKSPICAAPFTSTPPSPTAATPCARCSSAARERGFEYVGISDHSPAAFYAGGLSVEQLGCSSKEIAAQRARRRADARLSRHGSRHPPRRHDRLRRRRRSRNSTSSSPRSTRAFRCRRTR